nr:Uncharacterised protein [Raoultella sp. NCTC 9187]
MPAAADAPLSSFNRLVLTLSATPIKPTFTAVTELPQGDRTMRNGHRGRGGADGMKLFGGVIQQVDGKIL